MSLAINDKVTLTIIENGYWKGETIGTITGETAKFWIVSGKGSSFWNSTKRSYVPRRVAKISNNGCYLSKKVD
jgi:hypothetical protein